MKCSDRLFMAWIGPRGIASLLYLLLVLVELGKNGNQKMIAVISLTVFFSLFLHGITAIPLSKQYSKMN